MNVGDEWNPSSIEKKKDPKALLYGPILSFQDPKRVYGKPNM